MKDTKGPKTQAPMFLKTEEVAFTNYLYVMRNVVARSCPLES